METRLAKAVLQLFHDEPALFPAFSVREWERSYYWLDASGIALYVLERLRSLGLEESLPPEVARRLANNQIDNNARTQDIFEEFVRINTEFQQAGLFFANLKGFSLLPDAFTHPSLRCQLDLDFLLLHRDAGHAAEILKQMGYVLTGASSSVWEFKADAGTLPSLQDMYKPKPQRSVEIHFLPSHEHDDSETNLLVRAQTQEWNGFSFSALQDHDKFIALADHLFRHLRSEWTRLSWVLEFRQFVLSKKKDTQFWKGLHAYASAAPEITLAIGACLRMATLAFGEFAPQELTVWTMNVLPVPVCRWIERYGEAILLSEFPGTKLYLLLDAALSEGSPETKSMRRKKLFPLHRAPRIVYGSAKDTLRLRAGRALVQGRYTLFRLRFHVVQGIRYFVEAQRWKHMSAVPQN